MSVFDLRCGDCNLVMPTLLEASFDLACWSPPYNVGINYDKRGYEADSLKMEDYKDFADETMRNVARLLKVGGRACVEIGGSGRNFPLSWTWQDAAFKSGLGLYSEISIQHRKTNQCAWGSWMKADWVSTVPNFHMLYVFYKDVEKKSGTITTISRTEFIEWTRGSWKIAWGVPHHGGHPAAYPLEIPARCLKLFGHLGDNVIDPMMGIGTTGLACFRLGRTFTGIELSERYFKIGKDRLDLEENQIPLFPLIGYEGIESPIEDEYIPVNQLVLDYDEES